MQPGRKIAVMFSVVMVGVGQESMPSLHMLRLPAVIVPVSSSGRERNTTG